MKKILASLMFASVVGLSVSADASPVGGTRSVAEIVEANSTDFYQVVLRGNERWFISVTGDGDTDLDCYVYDANGNQIAFDIDPSDECRLTEVPAWTGTFTIRIVNRGDVYNRYVMRVM